MNKNYNSRSITGVYNLYRSKKTTIKKHDRQRDKAGSLHIKVLHLKYSKYINVFTYCMMLTLQHY